MPSTAIPIFSVPSHSGHCHSVGARCAYGMSGTEIGCGVGDGVVCAPLYTSLRHVRYWHSAKYAVATACPVRAYATLQYSLSHSLRNVWYWHSAPFGMVLA
eukprot:3199054-Rhodomonas_salina.1